MKANVVADQLLLQYPGKQAIFLPDEENPSEIIVEIEKTDIPSTAMAVIDRSAPHFHRRMRDIYRREGAPPALRQSDKGHP